MVGNEGGVVLLELLHAGIVLHRRHHGRNMPKQAPHDAAVPQGVARDLVRIELGPLDRPAEQSPVVGCVNLLPPRAVLLEQERCIVRPIAPGALIRYTALAGGRLVAKNAGVVSVEDDDDIKRRHKQFKHMVCSNMPFQKGNHRGRHGFIFWGAT